MPLLNVDPTPPTTNVVDTITLDDWLKDSSVKPSTIWNRRKVVRNFEKANDCQIDEALQAIREGRLSPYLASRKFMDTVRKSYSPYSALVYRSILAVMLESVLGEPFSRRKYNILVPNGPAYVTHAKQIPERPQIIEMLKIAPPLGRALIGLLAVSGLRIMEALTRKWSDLEIREQGYARIRLRARETKAKYERYTFCTRETIDFLKSYRASRGMGSEYVFPRNDGHLEYTSAHDAVKPLFTKIGLKDSPDRSEIWTIHSYRTAGGDMMRDCGLKERDVLAVIGHVNKLGADAHYLDWRKVEKNWADACAEKMCFLTPPDYEQVKKENGELTRTNGKLEALLERMLERLDPENFHKP